MVQSSLATRLRVLRAERELTLREAATRVGVRPGTLSELERGMRHPHDRTLSRIAKGYGVSIEELLEGPAGEPAREPVPLAEAPGEGTTEGAGEPEQWRRLSYVRAWSDFVDEMAGDVEEWKYAEAGYQDPADLPEEAFLAFARAATSLAKTYRLVSKIVHERLKPALQSEPRTPPVEEEIERFERAFKRLSRGLLSVVTEGVEKRVARMAEEKGVPSNVLPLFSETRKSA
jgi:transcriptional regulator with XRE-family HTH domain